MLDVQGSPDLSKGPDKQPSDSDPWKFASNWILKVPLQYCNPSIMSRNLAFYCDDFILDWIYDSTYWGLYEKLSNM